jgi:hypothetical protein
MRIGKYSSRNNCRFCKSLNIDLVIDLGLTPLAGDFLKKDQIGKESFYPLRIFLCKECHLVQVLDIIPPEVLFKDYRYMSSIGLSNHFESYAADIEKDYVKKNGFIVEIGSNDGVLLAPLKNRHFQVLGIDPAENIANFANQKGLETWPTFFNNVVAIEVLKKYGYANAIIANNVLAHIDDMDEIISGIDILLDSEGVLIFEVHYLVNLLKDLQYDFFYQEHLCYYSLTSLIPYLKKFGLEIFDVKQVPTHSGSIRVFARKSVNNKYRASQRLKKLLLEEKKLKLDSIQTYLDFMKRIESHKREVQKTLMQIKNVNKKIIGYGASGRANTLLNYCNIDSSLIDYVVDSSPERYGRYMPQSHIPIVNPDFLHKDSFDCVVILAWNYADMIIKKEYNHFFGKSIFVPLPMFKQIYL